MRKIDRPKELEFWMQYKKMHPKEQYKNLEKTEEGNKLRQDLREFLVQSQYGLCAYCCRKIDLVHSLNEHIKPQSTYSNESMNYDNLIASCKTEGINPTCGVKKGNLYDEKLFVSPLEEHCEEEFVFYPNGQIEGLGERGEYTCKILNLNAIKRTFSKIRRVSFFCCQNGKLTI